MTLSRYIAWRFLKTLGMVFFIFFGILMLIDMIDQLRRFSSANISLFQTMQLSLLNVPQTLYRILPLIFVISSVALFLGLSRSSELVVVRTAGRSGLRFLATPVFVALITGVLAVAVFNPIVAATSKAYDDLAMRYQTQGNSITSVSEGGLWLRQGGSDGQTVIHAARANYDGTTLLGVSFMTFGHDGLPATRIEAQKAELAPGAWILTNAKSWDLTAANPEATAQNLAEGTKLTSDLTAARIRDSFGTPSAIPIWQLPNYISGLERAGFSALSYKLWFQMELAQPLLLAAMVLVAAGFTMRHARAGNSGKMVLYAVLAGFALFFLRNFAQALGESGQIPIALAAWSPPLAAVLSSLGFLLHLEDG